jgi:hypothetical protein
MGLTMKERYAIIRELAPRYQRSSKGERSKILDEFVRLTGLVRSYASHVLKVYGTRRSVVVDGRPVVVIVGQTSLAKRQRKRARRYDHAVLDALKRLWAFSNGLCGKRLAVFVRQTLPILERFGELDLDQPVRTKLLTVSPATIDRLFGIDQSQKSPQGPFSHQTGHLAEASHSHPHLCRLE